MRGRKGQLMTQLNFTYNFRATLPCLGANNFHRAFETSHHPVLLWDLPTTAVRVKHLQHNEYANRPAFGYICFNELRNAVSREEAVPSRKKAIKVCPVFPNLYKAKGVYLPRVFIARYFARIPHSTLFPSSRFLSRRVTLLFCSNISIAKVSLVFHSANGTVRLDQGFFFQVSTLVWKVPPQKLKLSELHSHAAYFVILLRACPERLGPRQFTDLTKVLSRVV